jgi:hypothetical protein
VFGLADWSNGGWRRCRRVHMSAMGITSPTMPSLMTSLGMMAPDEAALLLGTSLHDAGQNSDTTILPDDAAIYAAAARRLLTVFAPEQATADAAAAVLKEPPPTRVSAER